jgi:hypothetical protein
MTPILKNWISPKFLYWTSNESLAASTGCQAKIKWRVLQKLARGYFYLLHKINLIFLKKAGAHCIFFFKKNIAGNTLTIVQGWPWVQLPVGQAETYPYAILE